MKLELKHLAGYLPYGLKLLSHEKEIQLLTGVRDETYFIEKGNVYAYGDIQDCKPILRPLSDLTKEIEVNGKEFIPLEYLNINPSFIKIDFIEESPFYIVRQLLEWHFDIHGLIEAGLAIDINTLNN